MFCIGTGKFAAPFDKFKAHIVPERIMFRRKPYTADVFWVPHRATLKDNVEFILGDVDTATGVLAKDAIVLPFEAGNGKINIPTSGIGK